MRVQEHSMLYYPGEARTCNSIKYMFQALYNSKKTTGDPTCPAIVRHAKREWDCIKEKMDFSGGEGVLNNDMVSAGVDNGDDDVDEEEEDAEGGTNNIEELNTEVSSGEGTYCVRQLQGVCQQVEGIQCHLGVEQVVGLLQFPLFIPCRLFNFELQGIGTPPIHRQHHLFQI